LVPAEKAAIALVFINGGSLATPFDENETNKTTIEMLQATIAEVKNAFPHLEGSLLKRVQYEDGDMWQFRHPTVRDAFANIIGKNSELVDIYLQGVPAEKMIDEITCGNIGLEGVKVVIPATRYLPTIEKLSSLPKHKARSFLATSGLFC
jgi:hypothetical protein